jgi:hypothetical protein
MALISGDAVVIAASDDSLKAQGYRLGVYPFLPEWSARTVLDFLENLLEDRAAALEGVMRTRLHRGLAIQALDAARPPRVARRHLRSALACHPSVATDWRYVYHHVVHRSPRWPGNGGRARAQAAVAAAWPDHGSTGARDAGSGAASGHPATDGRHCDAASTAARGLSRMPRRAKNPASPGVRRWCQPARREPPEGRYRPIPMRRLLSLALAAAGS